MLDQIEYFNHWDCWCPVTSNGQAPAMSYRLFGNANIGNLSLSSLSTGGRLGPSHATHIITNWYARTTLGREMTDGTMGRPYPSQRAGVVFDNWAQTTFATMVIGLDLRWQMPIYDLMRSWRRGEPDDRPPVGTPLWPVVLPNHEAIFVNVMTLNHFRDGGYSSTEALESVLGEDANRGNRMLVWVHLEGIRIPETVDPNPIIAALARHSAARTTEAEAIAQWVAGRACDETELAVRAELAAISDGIREGRHRAGFIEHQVDNMELPTRNQQEEE